MAQLERQHQLRTAQAAQTGLLMQHHLQSTQAAQAAQDRLEQQRSKHECRAA